MSDNATPEPEPQPLSGKDMERLLLLADWSGPAPAEALGWTERTLDEAFERNNAELRRAAERLSERPTTGEEQTG
jgi:hypothetical protein